MTSDKSDRMYAAIIANAFTEMSRSGKLAMFLSLFQGMIMIEGFTESEILNRKDLGADEAARILDDIEREV